MDNSSEGTPPPVQEQKKESFLERVLNKLRRNKEDVDNQSTGTEAPVAEVEAPVTVESNPDNASTEENTKK